MDCVNHSGVNATAYCQSCGKALCEVCVRKGSGGQILCEPCWMAWQNAQRSYVPPPMGGPSPGLAALLGAIPGVGAMYNGQFVKGMVHVVIFAVLVSAAHVYGVFGLFIAAWIFYQMFEAYHTARARRDGDPLPDPLGLNEVGTWFSTGMRPPQGPYPGPPSGAAATGANQGANRECRAGGSTSRRIKLRTRLPINQRMGSGRSSDPANSAFPTGAADALAAQRAGGRRDSNCPGRAVSAGAVRLVFVALVPL